MPILRLFNIHPPKVCLLQLINLHEAHHDHAMPIVKVHSWCCIFCGPGQIIACSHHYVIRVVSLPPKFSVLLFLLYLSPVNSSPGSSAGKEFTCNAGDLGSVLGWEDPWRRKRLPTPVFWPREFHGLYSPGSHKESDTEQLSLPLFPQPLATADCSFYCFHSFSFSRISYSWDHTMCSLFILASFT